MKRVDSQSIKSLFFEASFLKKYIRPMLYLLPALCVSMMLSSPSKTYARVGVGFMIGVPTGVSAQLKLTSKTALNGALSYDFIQGWILVGGDLRYIGGTFHRGQGAFYWGVGGMMSLSEKDKGGENSKTSSGIIARLPLGIEYRLNRSPLQGFIEIVPSLMVFPRLTISPKAALGLRYHF